MKAKDVNNRSEYLQYVSEIVDILESEYDLSNDNNPHSTIHHMIDSDRMVMYFSNYMTVLQYSPNEPQEWKHLVGESDQWREVMQTMAYDVFRQDVWEEINSRDIEI